METVGLKGTYESIGNVVDTDLFTPTENSNNKCQIIYVGNIIQKHKRILDLIRIIGQLSEERSDFELSIYGEGIQEKECLALVQKNNWHERIHLMGTLDRKGIAEKMAQSDFLILYSETENQPCVINEAQACGLPVVVPSIEGIVERMNDQLGIVFTKTNPTEFKASLNKMLDEYQQYNKQFIRAFAEKEYSESNIAKRFEKLYQQVISNTPNS